MIIEFILNNITYDYRKDSIDADGVYQLDVENKTYVFVNPISPEITAEVSRLQAEYDSKQYARLRKAEYDELNQFELISDDAINGTTIWLDTITAIKAKYPKGDK